MQPKREEKDGLRESVFRAIQGGMDRVSMSPIKCSITRSHSTSKQSPKPKWKGSTGSLTKKDITINFEAMSNKSSLPSSMESLVSQVPSICISEPFEPQIAKVPAATAKEVDEATRTDWLRNCRKGNIDEVKKMLDKQKGLVNYVPPHGYNYAPIHVASLGQHLELLRLLKERGADLDLQTKMGYTALHLAAQNNRKETISALLNLGVDPTIKDNDGQIYKHYLPPKTDDESDSRGNSLLRPRPSSQSSIDGLDSRHQRSGSFRNTLKKILPSAMQRSTSPKP